MNLVRCRHCNDRLSQKFTKWQIQIYVLVGNKQINWSLKAKYVKLTNDCGWKIFKMKQWLILQSAILEFAEEGLKLWAQLCALRYSFQGKRKNAIVEEERDLFEVSGFVLEIGFQSLAFNLALKIVAELESLWEGKTIE